jgi:ADP-heptose:LPS heptosyltransferase
VSGWKLARHVGCEEVRALPPALVAPDGARARTRAALHAAGISDTALASGSVIALNPGRPVPSKQWRGERFVELARRLRREGREVVIFWGPSEQTEAVRIAREAGAVCAPELSLAEMLAALSWCGALVTIDSGLKHLAVCARTPTVTLFGSTDPREWHMGSSQDAVLWKGFSCSPCRRLACPFGTPCMDIDINDVMSALARVTKEPS